MGGANAADRSRPSDATDFEATHACKEAKPGGPEDLVRKLYADYPFDGPDVADEPRQKLEKYFDQRLVLLLIKEQECPSKTREMCDLDSSIMYAAQGGNVTDIRVCTMETSANTVNVQFRNNGEPQVVIYKLSQGKAGWKIADVLDVNSFHESLVESLARELTERGLLPK